jgi:hypothetical protein
MKRLFLAFLLLVGAVLTIPPLRQRAQPRIDAVRETAGQKLEGPMSPVLTPYRRVKTKAEMSKAVTELIADRNRGYPAPAPNEFGEYLVRKLGAEEATLDAWGSPYIIAPDPDSLEIISAGPDLQYRTDDDLQVKIRYPGARPRPGTRR